MPPLPTKGAPASEPRAASPSPAPKDEPKQGARQPIAPSPTAKPTAKAPPPNYTSQSHTLTSRQPQSLPPQQLKPQGPSLSMPLRKPAPEHPHRKPSQLRTEPQKKGQAEVATADTAALATVATILIINEKVMAGSWPRSISAETQQDPGEAAALGLGPDPPSYHGVQGDSGFGHDSATYYWY